MYYDEAEVDLLIEVFLNEVYFSNLEDAAYCNYCGIAHGGGHDGS
jgi:hypothetical protein